MKQHKNFLSNTILRASLGLIAVVGILSLITYPVAAQATVTCPDGRTIPVGPGAAGVGIEELCKNPLSGESVDRTYVKNDCGGTDIKAGEPQEIDGQQNPNHCGILDYLVIFINVLSGLAAIAVVAAVIYGGIQYSMAGSDPQKVSAAKSRIRNAIIALIFFIFGYAILNWLVPGGVLP